MEEGSQQGGGTPNVSENTPGPSFHLVALKLLLAADL